MPRTQTPTVGTTARRGGSRKSYLPRGYKTFQEEPFDRYADLSGLTHIRFRIDHIIQTARRRRKAKQPVKSALFADKPIIFSIANMYEMLMSDAMIEVRAFKGRAAAAEWLEVPMKILYPPS